MSGPVVRCPYCDKVADFVDGRTVYPHRPDLARLRFYVCEPCGARVGCHRGTNNPLGVLANGPLRTARLSAHAAFDPLWKGGGMSRASAYKWLASELGISESDCHIGMFDEDQCARTVAAVSARARTEVSA